MGSERRGLGWLAVATRLRGIENCDGRLIFGADYLPAVSEWPDSDDCHVKPFQFKKRSQLFFRTHNETLSVVAMRVNDPDRLPVGINR